jgi:hypothetical protein
MAGKNNIEISESRKSLFPSAVAVIDATISFAQGDLMFFDEATNLVKKVAAEADCATFLGLAVETVSLGKLVKPYSTDVDASAAITDVPGPVYGVVAKLVSKTGIVWAPGDLAYSDPATGTRGVTNLGTKAIGIYQGKAITAVAGQEILVMVGARFGGDVLKF